MDWIILGHIDGLDHPARTFPGPFVAAESVGRDCGFPKDTVTLNLRQEKESDVEHPGKRLTGPKF